MTTSTTDPLGTGQPTGGHYAPVNGLKLYYEIHGTGRPLVLLHGGFGTIAGMFDQLLPPLAATRQVIAVELQGHGHTADIDRPLRYELLADDIAALLRHLGLAQADLCGYSLGGGVALQTAIRHPQLVGKLVLISTVGKRQGWYAEDSAAMATMTAEVGATWVGSPMHAAYAGAAPHPEDWPVLVGKMGDLLREDYDWSEAIAAIPAPTLIVAGDADGVRLTHAVEMLGLRGAAKAVSFMDPLPTSQLAILPGTTHLSILTRADLLPPIILSFLDSPSAS
jgi:pimeloyl-ACP methyl ester carboxylesterase